MTPPPGEGVGKVPKQAVTGRGRGGGAARRAGSKSEFAYELIRERITDGTYGPGYRLIFDRIALELKVSPVPVREAIRRLEAEGYVVYKRNVGAEVAFIDAAEYAQVMEVLAILEAAATALAVPHLSAEDLSVARQHNLAMRRHLAMFDPLSFTRANREFHTVLFSRCSNDHLLLFLHREWKRLDAIRRSTFSFVPGRAHEAVQEHDRLLELIERRADPTDVEWFAREHRMATAEAFQTWHHQHSPEAPAGAGDRPSHDLHA
ncbi:MAG: GntR family transcriptional regulator [Acidimicrobiales bacterium]